MNNVSRRKLIAALSVGGVVTASKIPATWSRPVIDAVALPAHAQTTGAVLSGGGSFVANEVTPGGEQVASAAAVARRVLDMLVEQSLAADDGPPIVGVSTEIFGYCQSLGSGSYLVQVLLRVGNPIWLGESSDLKIVDGLVNQALAGDLEIMPDCYAAVLYERTVAVAEVSPGVFRSAVLTEPNPKDSCGVPPGIFPLSPLGMLLEVNDSSAPTAGTLFLGPPDDIGAGDSIALAPGGNPLFADCLGDECELVSDS